MKLVKKIILICLVLTLITGTSITVYFNIFKDAAVDVGEQIYDTISDETKEEASNALQELLNSFSDSLKSFSISE